MSTTSMALPQPSGVPINWTDIGPIGPSAGIGGDPFSHPNNTVCLGTVYNVTVACCKSINGTIQEGHFGCDNQCCHQFSNHSTDNPNCPPNGWYITTPWCVIPAGQGNTTWNKCYNDGTQNISTNMITCLGPENNRTKEKGSAAQPQAQAPVVRISLVLAMLALGVVVLA